MDKLENFIIWTVGITFTFMGIAILGAFWFWVIQKLYAI